MKRPVLRILLVLLWGVTFVQGSDEGGTLNIEERLRSLETAAKAVVNSWQDDADKYASLAAEVTSLMEEVDEMMNLEIEVAVQRTHLVEDLLRAANAVQLQYLAWQLNATIEKELEQRAKEEEVVTESVDLSNAVTVEELQEKMQPNAFLDESGKRLEEWFQNFMREQVVKYHNEASVASSEKCVSPVELTQLVQASLMTHAHEGMVDHAQGASIVYELTSYSFVPPAEQLLGDVWWRKYVPQDLERILPSGWEEWSAQVPSYVTHLLGWKGEAVSPEVILTASTHPGSCWPMQGNAGQVTIRLPYPVKVKAVTVEHASSLLVGEKASSAPKSIRVIAYPPCSDCQGMGFDTSQAWELTDLVYEVEGSSAQTFEIVPPTSGSCSEEELSCAAGAEPVGDLHVASAAQQGGDAAAVSVVVLDNWGADDYTCLYRFRVHGDPVESQ